MNTWRATRCLAVAALAVSLSSCSSNDDDGAAPGTTDPTTTSNLSGLDLTAHVDPVTASVSLPSDRLLMTFAEEKVLMSAASVAEVQCIRAQGVPWDFSSGDGNEDPLLNVWDRYGPWTTDIAQRFAFVQPQSDDSLIRNGIIIPATPPPEPDPPTIDNLTQEQLAASKECEKDPQVVEFSEAWMRAATPWQTEIADGLVQAETDPRALQLFEELGACYADNGMDMDPERPGLPVGAQQYAVTREVEVTDNCVRDGPKGGEGTCGTRAEPTGESPINEEQIALALKTVQCKDSINFTRRIADLIAEKEAPAVEKYAQEIVAERQQVDDILTTAREYIATHRQK
ncbi:MAG: hypothetical protein QM705_01245 [Ancrocorticia sp.]